MYLAIGNTVRLFTRAMYVQIEARKSWEKQIVLEDFRQEIDFWLSQLSTGFVSHSPLEICSLLASPCARRSSFGPLCG